MNRVKHLLLVSIPFVLVGIPDVSSAQRVSGKVFFTTQPIKDRSEKALARQFAKEKPTIELKRNKDKSWEVTMVAFFRRKAHPGPITFWFYDVKDKAAIKAKEPVHEESVNSPAPKKTFIHNLLIDPSRGFNKNRTYHIWVGQIFGKRNKVYAKGLIVLKP